MPYQGGFRFRWQNYWIIAHHLALKRTLQLNRNEFPNTNTWFVSDCTGTPACILLILGCFLRWQWKRGKKSLPLRRPSTLSVVSSIWCSLLVNSRNGRRQLTKKRTIKNARCSATTRKKKWLLLSDPISWNQGLPCLVLYDRWHSTFHFSQTLVWVQCLFVCPDFPLHDYDVATVPVTGTVCVRCSQA